MGRRDASAGLPSGVTMDVHLCPGGKMRIRQKIRPIQLDADWQTPVEPQSVQNPSPKNLDLVLPCFQIRPIRPFRPVRPKTQMYSH